MSSEEPQSGQLNKVKEVEIDGQPYLWAENMEAWVPSENPRLAWYRHGPDGGLIPFYKPVAKPYPPGTPHRIVSPADNRADILQAAIRALDEREGTYGPIEEHHARTAAVVSALLGMKFKPEWVAIFFIADKLARHMHSHHIDNLVDICGYAECQNRVHQHQEQTDDQRPGGVAAGV